jgi:hypothetical protein
MGTDIHLWVEKQSKDGTWYAVKGTNEPHLQWMIGIVNDKTTTSSKYWKERIKEVMAGTYQDWLYEGRNYDLFAILANVRNGRGFAGIETGTGFDYIHDPRGFPDDVSDEVGDPSWGHSASWLSAREIVEFNWDQKTIQYGVVNEGQYKVFKEKGAPESYSGGVSGLTIQHISNEEMEDLINGTYPRQEDMEYYTRVSWGELYKDAVGDFYDWSIPKLKELAGDDLDSVRIVFFFDS